MAEQLLRESPEEFPDGIVVVELASLAEPNLVTQSVAFALGLRDAPGRTLLDTLLEHLTGRRALILLDNCEHLLDACASLAHALLAGCPDLEILTTSREPLGIAGETSWRVPSLDSPKPEELPAAPTERVLEVARYEAVRLFVERAQAVLPSFAVNNQNAQEVAQVCWRLDGIPLAIELAAARVRGLSVEQLASRLDDRFKLLTGGSRTALRRQQTLRATIDWSYDLLSDPEKVLLRRLSVFVGGWTLEVAEETCHGRGVEEHEVVDLLLRLVDRSLVVADTENQPARYHLPETIRQYAGEKLLESGESASVRDRHLQWYLELAERAAVELNGRDRRVWLERLDEEYGNLRAALDWPLARDEDAEPAHRLAAALGRYWNATGRSAESRERLESVLARPGGDPAVRMAVLRHAGEEKSYTGSWRRAREWHEEALALAREAGDKRLISHALLSLSWVASDLGERVEARALQEEALELARETGDRQRIAETLHHLAFTRFLQGDDEAASSLAEEGLSTYRELDNSSGIGLCLSLLGHLAFWEGDLVRARALAEAGVALAREARSGVHLSYGLSVLGHVARADRDFAAAETHYRDALAVFQQRTAAGDWMRTTSFLLGLAGLWVEWGRAHEAAHLFGATEGWLKAMGMPVPWMPPLGYERDEAAAREALGEEAFADAWAEGQAMTLEQAVEYALLETG